MAKRQQQITLQDVADQVGVSLMTVSRVLNNTDRVSEATRQQVLKAIQDLGYRPSRAARSLASHKTFLLGVVVPDITNPFFAEVVRGIEEVAWEYEYSVLLSNTRDTQEQEHAILDRMDTTLIDGLISCSSRLPAEVLHEIVMRQKAVALVNRTLPDMPAAIISVCSQQEQRPGLAVEHLVRSGRRRIGFAGLKHRATLHIPSFKAAVQAAGLDSDDSWVLVAPHTWAGGFESARQLIACHPDMDALVCGNDLMALGAMRAIHDAGRSIPADIALTGGDDTPLACQVEPPLTTFRSNSYAMGRTAAGLLFERLGGREQFEPVSFPEEIVIRASAP